MARAKGFVAPPGGGRHLDMATPGRSAALKLVGHQTNGSIMLFEQTVPVGTKSFFHLHRDSDEVAWVLAGEITFGIGDEVAIGGRFPLRGSWIALLRARSRLPDRKHVVGVLAGG